MIEAERILIPADVVVWLAERGLEMSEQSVRRHIAAGQLPGYEVAGRYLIPLPWLVRWLYGLPPKVVEIPGELLERADVPAPAVISFVGRRSA